MLILSNLSEIIYWKLFDLGETMIMKNIGNKIEIINEQINKINELDKKIQNELSIKVPQYILDEIIIGGTKENIIALTKLAKLNNRITEQDANIFIKNLDKYL